MDKSQIIVWIILGVAAIGKWLFENSDVLKGGGSDNVPDKSSRPEAPRSMRPQTDSNPGEETEEERMRRFMEALGIPQGSVPPPMRKPMPPPAPPKSVPPVAAAGPQQSAPKPYGKLRRPIDPFPRPVSPVAPTAPRQKIAPPLEAVEPIPAIPKTASVTETAPSMEVANLPQISSSSSQPAAPTEPAQQPARSASKPTRPPEPVGVAGMAGALVEQLRDPASLRRAFLLREILSAPKGLQSEESLSIFSPL